MNEISERYREIRFNITRNVKMNRRKKKYTQEQMGELLGITRRTYANYENGVHAIPAEILAVMTEIFSVTMDELTEK